MIRKLSRRITWLFVVVCLASSAAADSYHPHIVKSQVVSLDVAAIERHANSGTPFELAFGDTQLTVALSPSPVWPKEGLPVLEVVKGEVVAKRIVQGNITYAGDVVGEDPEKNEARFTIVRGVLEGYVRSSTGWWHFEPLARFDPKADAGQYLVYATRDLDFVLDLGNDLMHPGEVYDCTLDPSGDGVIPVAMFADMTYITRPGETMDSIERHAALIHALNGIYKPETGREFRMSISIGDPWGTEFTSTDPGRLLEELIDFVFRLGGLHLTGGHFAHLTTGMNVDGDVLGAVPELKSRYGFSQQVRVPAVTFPPGLSRALAFQNLIVAAHEIGHNFNGDHAEAEWWCGDDLPFCWDEDPTIMWREFRGDNNGHFSRGEQTPTRNNRRRIRTEMSCRGF